MEKVLLLQIIAHIFADFIFQPEKWCISKHEKGYRSFKMYWHFGIVLLMSIIMTFSSSFILYALIIATLHLLTDLSKSHIERYIYNKKSTQSEEKKTYSNHYIFIFDQLLHLIVIYTCVSLYMCHNAVPFYLEYIDIYHLLIFLCFLLCLKPANIIIKILLSFLNLPFSPNTKKEEFQENEDLERAGRRIGAIERSLALILVLLGQFTAMGFIITAKSILRYNNSPLGKAEYVLIGTLLSFGIAMILGIGITKDIFTKILNLISI
jgi:Protein of unknown function (DUF3307).